MIAHIRPIVHDRCKGKGIENEACCGKVVIPVLVGSISFGPRLNRAWLRLCRMNFEQYLTSLPTYDFALTYGSGVFRQKGYSEKDKKNAMLDVIIGVKDPEAWHKENLLKNPKHYSGVRHLGAHSIVRIEVGSGWFRFLSGVWFGSCLLQSSCMMFTLFSMRRRWVRRSSDVL